MRSTARLVPFVALLSACAFDLDPYQAVGEDSSAATTTGSGGAPSASVSTGAAGSTSSASTTDASSSGAEASSSSSSSGTGGGPVALAPCGGFTDDFQQFTTPPWIKHDASHVGPTNKKYVQMEIGFDIYANARLGGAEYHDCYASIDVVGQSGGSASLRLYQSLLNQTSIAFDMGHDLSFPGDSIHVDGWVRALGIAFVGDQVFYLYVAPGSDVWEPPVKVEGRSDWMSDGDDDQLGFGVNGVINDSASFDQFNMRPITYDDLGISP